MMAPQKVIMDTIHTIQSIRNKISSQEVVVVRFTDEIDSVTDAMLDNGDWPEHLQKSFTGLVALDYNVICGKYEDVDYFYDAYRAYKGVTPANELTLLSDDDNQWIHEVAIMISDFYDDPTLTANMIDLGIIQN